MDWQPVGVSRLRTCGTAAKTAGYNYVGTWQDLCATMTSRQAAGKLVRMNGKVSTIMVWLSVLALSVTACGIQSAAASGPVGARIDLQSTPEVNPAQGTTVESVQVVQSAPVSGDASKDVAPVDIPSLEEREAVLNGVNLAPPIDEGEPIPLPAAGPAPGTESGPALEKVPSGSIESNQVAATQTDSGFISQLVGAVVSWFRSVLARL